MGTYHCSEQKALDIAFRLFRTYDSNRSGAIEGTEALSMLNDTMRNLTTVKPTIGDAESFIRTHDVDRDGKLTLKDLEKLAKKYFCSGPQSSTNPQVARPDFAGSKKLDEGVYSGLYHNYGESHGSRKLSDLPQDGNIKFEDQTDASKLELTKVQSQAGNYASNQNYQSPVQPKGLNTTLLAQKGNTETRNIVNKYTTDQGLAGLAGSHTKGKPLQMDYNKGKPMQMGETKGKPMQMGETKKVAPSDTSSRQGMEVFDSKQPESISDLDAESVDTDFHERIRTVSGGTMSEKEILVRQLTRDGSIEEVEQQLRLALSIFEQYDTDRNGFIEKHEVIPILIDTYRIMGINFKPTASDIGNYIDMMDTDRNGKISMEELELFLLKALMKHGIII